MNPSRIYKTITLGFVALIVLSTSLFPQRMALGAGVVGTGTPGSCTEAAFEAALSGGGTITFNCGAAHHTIILTSYKLILDDTEIQGNHRITLSGANATSIFLVSSATLTLRDIILTHGFGTFGTIRNFGNLNLIDSQITYGYSPSSGGAIENYGEVNLTRAILAHNEAANTAGALFNDWGDVTIKNSQIYSNTGKNDSGAITNNFGIMNIQNSQIYDNQSLDCSSNSRGGGILNTGDSNNGALTITQSTISNNNASNGGGIYNNGPIYLEDVTIAGNRVYGACYGNGSGMVNNFQATVVNTKFINNTGASYGGGLMNGSNSQMTISGSLFRQNQAQSGGGIMNSGTLTLTDSTIYTNTSNYGGGIANGTAGGTPNILTLTNATISDNSSLSGGGGLQNDNGTATITYATFVDNHGGSGIDRWGGQIIMKNSIVTNSTPKNCNGGITSQGFNIASDYSCGFSQAGDHQNTDPRLGSLLDNGGQTQTHLPNQDSPAIDGGQCVAGIATDQRGTPRPQAAACDIGAVEVVPTQYIFLPMIIRK